jgi:hypothetical protein
LFVCRSDRLARRSLTLTFRAVNERRLGGVATRVGRASEGAMVCCGFAQPQAPLAPDDSGQSRRSRVFSKERQYSEIHPARRGWRGGSA